MKTSVSAKRCPECGKAAMLQAASCQVCGHRFRTHFLERPVEKTEAFTLMVVPPAATQPPRRAGGGRPSGRRAFRAAFWSGFLLVALVGGLFCLAWNVRQQQAAAALFPPQAAASPAPAASAAPAVHLYESIKPMMSLYDLAKTAGGMGRVIRASDPHLLLLSYDYPHQSVHVSLSRTDLAGTDYQVQAVSLYQGKTLLERHAVVE